MCENIPIYRTMIIMVTKVVAHTDDGAQLNDRVLHFDGDSSYGAVRRITSLGPYLYTHDDDSIKLITVLFFLFFDSPIINYSMNTPKPNVTN